jgi:demethylmenaquinone methyltransferase/2-methoxy-6-polyprenyl-1,4-benzoquinol methylase
MSSPRTAAELAHARTVREMFSRIARRYDMLNHVLSVNIDKRWRRRVRKILSDVIADPSAKILDVACGTGDLSIELGRESKASVIGSDFCRPMLLIAKDKSTGIPYVEGDALGLPFADSSFVAVTIAFGLRNLASFEDGLEELCRVLKPGGKLVVLEFSTPTVPGLSSLFNLYFRRILPPIGGAVSGSREAYEYLPNSVTKFPDQKALAELMRKVGFGSVEYLNLTGGIAAIHTGMKVR